MLLPVRRPCRSQLHCTDGLKHAKENELGHAELPRPSRGGVESTQHRRNIDANWQRRFPSKGDPCGFTGLPMSALGTTSRAGGKLSACPCHPIKGIRSNPPGRIRNPRPKSPIRNRHHTAGMSASRFASSPRFTRSYSAFTHGMVWLRSIQSGMGVRRFFLSRSANSTTMSCRV